MRKKIRILLKNIQNKFKKNIISCIKIKMINKNKVKSK
jgi:hypothetical protein